MTKYYAELDQGIRFHYDSKTDKASVARRIREKGDLYDVYDVAELTVEDLRALNRYLQQVLEMMEQRKWEETERNRCRICHDRE